MVDLNHVKVNIPNLCINMFIVFLLLDIIVSYFVPDGELCEECNILTCNICTLGYTILHEHYKCMEVLLGKLDLEMGCLDKTLWIAVKKDDAYPIYNKAIYDHMILYLFKIGSVKPCLNVLKFLIKQTDTFPMEQIVYYAF